MRARLLLAVALASGTAWSADWIYGGDPAGTRYSALKQIDRTNVSKLREAWRFDATNLGAAAGRGGLQTQPIVVNGVVYGNSPGGVVFALDGATGKKLWSWDSNIAGQRVRGYTYWSDGADARIFAGVGRYVYALNAKTGQPIDAFGAGSRIDLHQDVGRDPEKQSIALTTPGVIYKDLLIVGGRESEGLPASYGDIRAYDVRSGKLRWTFHTIPRPGEFGYDTWPKDAWTYTGAANNWAGMAVDEKRGIVYVPTGSAASDFYGANRAGDDLFANCLLALDAATGKRLWHFQVVKHDIWDRDLPSPPVLVTVKRNGKTVDAVAQATKHGYVFLFDRVNGTPLFPIEYRKFPASAVEGEWTAATQPLPAKPAPFARQLLTADLLTNRTPEAHKKALEDFTTFQSNGQFVPLALGKETVVFPGFDGGAEWGGQAFDPETALFYVNANDLAWTGSLAPNTPAATGHDLYTQQCAACHGPNLRGTEGQSPSLIGLKDRLSAERVTAIVRNGSGRMPGFPNLSAGALRAIVEFVMAGESRAAAPAAPSPFDLKFRFTGYKKFLDPDGYPAVAPPWGTLNAIDLNTGEYAWKVPLGEYPELADKNTGSENYGGPVVTAGGLVFIAATIHDRKFRAFDKTTGKLLWETVMPSSGVATPATYQIAGKQYVVVTAAGGKSKTGGTDAVYVAYALPD
jgi:quinoprotein glucose dehydrogenase